MSADGRFVRVYYEDLKRDHFAIWDDDELLVSWMRLAALADKHWPERPEMPARFSKRVIKSLTDAGLLIVDGHVYSIKGLDAIRTTDIARTTSATMARRSKHPAGMSSRRRQQRKHSPSTSDVAVNVASDDDVDVTNDVTMNVTANRDKSIEVAPDSVFADAQTESVAARDDGDVTVHWSHEDQELQRRQLRHPDQLQLQKLAESLTGLPYAMANVYGGLGAKAVTEQLAPYGFARVQHAWSEVAERVRANGGKPTLRQLVFGADDMLNPVPAARPSTSERDAEAQRSFDRRVERTKRELRALHGEPA